MTPCRSKKERIHLSPKKRVPKKVSKKAKKNSLFFRKLSKKNKEKKMTKRIIGLFQRYDKREIKIFEIATMMMCTSKWVRTLYRRYKKGEPLIKQRGHRQSKLTDKQRFFVRNTYKSLCYEDGNIWRTPSMQVLKWIVLEWDNNFPELSLETYRNIVKVMDEYPTGKRKSKKYRRRFEASFTGQLVQGDVSVHRWVPHWWKSFPLILFMDDKSRRVLYAKFVDSDNIQNHIIALKEMIYTYGKPIAIYYDNDPKYQKAHGQVIPPALQELSIKLINSTPYQPQGKGKVERKFDTFQKQLTFLLKEKNVQTLEEANKVLDEYVDRHNKTYSRAISASPDEIFKNDNDVFEPIPLSDIESVEIAFAKREIRKVDECNEISYNNVKYVVPEFFGRPLAGYKIDIRELPDGKIRLSYKNQFIVEYKKEVSYEKTE